MIFLQIFKAVVAALTALVKLLPVADLTPFNSAVAAASGVLQYARALNQWLPFTEALIALGVFLAAYMALHGANFMRRLISLFTGGGGA